MIEFSIRKFYKTADGVDITPKAVMFGLKEITAEQVEKAEASFDKLAAELAKQLGGEVTEMTPEQRKEYLEDERSDEDAEEDSETIRAS